jgi:hypothetical protein
MEGEVMTFTGTRRGVLARILRGSGVALALAAGVGVLTLGAPSATATTQPEPFTCKPGLVWREAYVGDVVCVTPERRQRIWDENGQGPSRRLPNSKMCKPGYVWREARPGDIVCVTPESRALTRSENANASDNWVEPEP